jgi:hypothetical protein
MNSVATASVHAAGQIHIGGILSRAFKVYRANVLQFCTVTLVAALPNLLVLLPAAAPALSEPTKSLIALVLDVCLNTLAQAVILFGALQHLRAEPVRLSAALQRTLARLLPIFGFTILCSLGFLGGLLLLVVPGLFWVTMWMAALPACALEGLGPVKCMRRSAQLTKGARWPIFAILALAIVVSVGGSAFFDLILRPAGVLARASGSLIWSAVPGAYWDSVFAILYFDLRAREGTDAAQVAAVFD